VVAARDIPSQKRYYPPESFPLLGDRTFLESVQHPQEPRRRLLEYSGKRLSLDQIAHRLADRENISPGTLRARPRPRAVSHLREQLVYAAIHFFEIPPARIADYLRLSPSAITRCFHRFRRRLLSEPSLEKHLVTIISSST
jgi:hypothetical protein